MGTTCIWHFKRNPFEKTRRQLQTQNQYHACKSDSASYQLLTFPIKKDFAAEKCEFYWANLHDAGIRSPEFRISPRLSGDLMPFIRKTFRKHPQQVRQQKALEKSKGGWLQQVSSPMHFSPFFNAKSHQICQISHEKRKTCQRKKMFKKLADVSLFCLIR